MGNEIQSECPENNKQTKKWRLSNKKLLKPKLQRETQHNISFDLGSVNNESPTASLSCSSFNVYAPRKLQQIESDFNKIREKFSNKAKCKQYDATPHPLSSKQRVELETKFDCMTLNVTKTIHGITHNFLDDIPNERALLEFWENNIRQNNDDGGIGIIIFHIDGMSQIHSKLGWKSGDEIIKKTGEKIKEYATWYAKDYNIEFKVFHPDFVLNEFVVVTRANNDEIMQDLCDCVLTDVARSVKCFFQTTTVWAGYTTNSCADEEDETIGRDDADYHFRSYYERAKYALNEAMKVSAFSDKQSDRIRKWFSPKNRLKKGKYIYDLIKLYYVYKELEFDDALDKIDECMKNGANLNYADKEGNTAFLCAICTKNEELIRYFMQFEFEMDHQNKLGRNALTMALKNEINERICVLIAERIKYPNVPDSNNVTPFVCALNCGYFKVMNVLEDKGAMNYKNWIISSCIKDHDDALLAEMESCGILFDAKLDDIGRSILHYAVLHQSMNIIHQCLKCKILSVNVIDTMGWTPLHYAAAKNYVHIISDLVKFGADILSKTDEGYLPINVAQKFGHCEAEYLLNRFHTERRREFRASYQVSLTGNSHSNIVLSPISKQLSVNEMDSDDSSYNAEEWNKENEDINTRPRGKSVSKSNTQCSVSASQTIMSNSENVNQSKTNNNNDHRCYKEPNVSIIAEDGFNEKVNKLSVSSDFYGDYDEYDYRDSSETSVDESNETRIIHPSFSDDIETANELVECKRRNSNEWIGGYLNQRIIGSP